MDFMQLAAVDLVETFFKVGVSLLLLLTTGLAGWLLKSVVDLRQRVAVNEAKDEACSKETDRRIREVKDDVKNLHAQILSSNAKLEKSVGDTNRLVRELGDNLYKHVAKLHEEIAVIKTQQSKG